MKTFKLLFVLRTRENTDVFITLDENINGIHSKRVNILYIFSFLHEIICCSTHQKRLGEALQMRTTTYVLVEIHCIGEIRKIFILYVLLSRVLYKKYYIKKFKRIPQLQRKQEWSFLCVMPIHQFENPTSGAHSIE